MNTQFEHRSGFTLIEIMAAILIMGMVLTVAGSILVSTLQARERIQKTFHRTNEGIAILQMMTRDISAAVGPERFKKPKKKNNKNSKNNNSSGDSDKRYFFGENEGAGPFGRDSLDFVTTEDTWDPDTQTFADFCECGYLLKQNPDKPDLFRLYRRTEPWIEEDPTRGGTLTKLHDRVVGLNFEFLKDGDDNENRQWVNSWDDTKEKTEGLPLAVRVTLVLRYLPEDESDDSSKKNDREFSTIITLRE